MVLMNTKHIKATKSVFTTDKVVIIATSIKCYREMIAIIITKVNISRGFGDLNLTFKVADKVPTL
jgi:hypothetical protein